MGRLPRHPIRRLGVATARAGGEGALIPAHAIEAVRWRTPVLEIAP